MRNDKKVDILAFGVHPDDIELACAGTLLKHMDQGKTVGIVDLTQGEMGSRGSGPLRLKEAAASAKILGVDFRYNLNMRDCFFQIDEENIRKVATTMRRHQPEIVLANSLSDRHPDHGRAAELIKQAAFYSGLIKMDTESLPAWRPQAIYHYIQDHNLTPDLLVDVTNFVEQKFESILAFSSQFNIEKEDGPQTPISGSEFINFIRAKMASYGRIINAPYAEGFNVTRTVGVEDLTTLR